MVQSQVYLTLKQMALNQAQNTFHPQTSRL